ncbi:MAG: 3-phosphoglycerate dehydrogenase, partial [Burkholderiales bacterium]
NLPDALGFVAGLDASKPDINAVVENGKKAFAGYELAGHTLGVVGLGRIGCLVAEAAIRLGMQVVGYDPEITVDAAWSLPAQVRKAHSLQEVLKASHMVSLHVPLVEATRRLIDGAALEQMRHTAVLLNFSREGVVDAEAVATALEGNKLGRYVCDFPAKAIHGHPKVIALPHLGASTREAEENCAVMVADQIRDYLENGTVRNSVNFPEAVVPRESGYRVAIANANVPNMLSQISTAMADGRLNIHNMLNKSLGDMAYTIVDTDSAVPKRVIKAIGSIEGVLAVRYLPAPT